MEQGPQSLGNILLVEDDVDSREILAEILESEGYRVACVANGREALDYLRSSTLPQLILLDLMMPVMDGWQFLEEQKRNPALAAIPVVVVTGVGARTRKAALLDVAGYLIKPIDLGALLGAVAHHCQGEC